MKANEIISVNPVSIELVQTLTDARLIEATQKIANIYTNAARYANDKNREISKILGTVATEKSYEADGFKSVAEYANKLFGINRQNAYALANAGKVYNDSTAPEVLHQLPPSKLAEIASLPEEIILIGLASGNISVNKTQKELREFARANKQDDLTEKVEVVKEYTIKTQYELLSDALYASAGESAEEIAKVDNWLEIVQNGHFTFGEWDEIFGAMLGYISGPSEPVEVAKLPNAKVSLDSTKATVTRKAFFTDTIVVTVKFFTYTPKMTEAPKAPKFTKAQLLAMLAEMEDDESDDESDET